MYSIKDVVEVGHSKFIGGSIQIEIFYEEILDSEERDFVLKIIDQLDHCLITDNEECLEWTERFFLIQNSTNIFEDINSIISYFIEFKKIEITYSKERYSSKQLQNNNIIEYCVKG